MSANQPVDLIAPKSPLPVVPARPVVEKRLLGFTYNVGGYKFGSGLGHGASGVVKRATSGTQPAVAIKVFTTGEQSKSKQTPRSKPVSMARVQNEVSCLLRCQGHPHVLEVKECMQSTDKFFLVTEAAQVDLFDHVYTKGRIPMAQARMVFRQLIQAVAHMHECGVGHRDIKPENILLTEDMRVKVCDFGYAAPWKRGDDKLPGTMGTVRCLPPEMIRRKGAPMPVHDPFAADVWSCGIALYFMLTGSFPFEADSDVGTLNNILVLNFRKRPKAITDDVWPLLQKLLQLDARKRPTASEILKDPFLLGRRPSQSL